MDKNTKIDLGGLKTQAEVVQDTKLAQEMERTSHMTTKKQKQIFMISAVAVVLLGLGTGYVVASMTRTTVLPLESSTSDTGTTSAAATIKPGQIFGSKDASAFKDDAEGIVIPGGIGSEGSHHLVRAGGPSQNVYLTSSVVDLKLFENAKVRIWGETFKAQKAGWLMDVGRVEVKELNAPLPDWVVAQQKKDVGSAGGE